MKKLAEDWFEMIHYDYLGHAGNLTYPYISLFSGDYFNTTVKRTVGKLQDLYSNNLHICLQELRMISFSVVNMTEKLRCCQLDLGHCF